MCPLKQKRELAIIKPVIEMVYVCENCGYLFSRAEAQDRCPDCGGRMVRSANAVEQSEFVSQVAGLIRDGREAEPRFPNLVETEISMLNSFAFKLPATALQIDSGMMVDVLVEYGESSADRSELIANVWARLVGGGTSQFLLPVRLPAREDEPRRDQVNRIFAALNENGTFKVKLYDFVAARIQDAAGGNGKT